MIQKIEVSNFKCFEHISLELSNLNLLSGMNSMGKSTVIQVLLLLRQAYEQNALEKGIYLNGKYTNLGVGKDILYTDAKENIINILIQNEQNDLCVIHNDSILLDQDYSSFELAQGYRIEQWRNDPTVDVENKRRFRTLLNKSVIYNSEEFEEERGSDFRTEFLHKEYTSKGCLLVYEMDGVAVSFLSNDYWKCPEIEGDYLELSDEGELEQYKVKIPNVSFQENIKSFSSYYEQKCKEWRYTDIVSGQDILKCVNTMFPNLILCENAIQGCKKDVGVSEAGQVYKRLLELQRVAEAMENKFDKELLTKATPESGETLKRFSVEHTFLLPDGNTQVFSWHTRFTGGYAGRIFFHPIPEKKVIYVGHIGHKLPTVKYH